MYPYTYSLTKNKVSRKSFIATKKKAFMRTNNSIRFIIFYILLFFNIRTLKKRWNYVRFYEIKELSIFCLASCNRICMIYKVKLREKNFIQWLQSWITLSYFFLFFIVFSFAAEFRHVKLLLFFLICSPESFIRYSYCKKFFLRSHF